MTHNIEVEGGKSVKLPTAGKYCDRDIVVTGGGCTEADLQAKYEEGVQAEYDRFWDAFQRNGERTNYYVAFYSDTVNAPCWTDDNFKPKYPIRPKNAQNMLNCSGISGDLTTKAEIDFSKTTNINGVFYYNTKLTRIGVIDVRKVSTGGLGLVSGCTALETIDEIIAKDDGTQFASSSGLSFTNCTSLKNVKITGVANFVINASACSKLTKASIESVFACLSTTTSGLSATFSKVAVDKAFETSEGAADGSTSAEWTALANTRSNWTINLV